MIRISVSLIALAMFAMPMGAMASTTDVEAQLRAMEARMTELEDKLESANDQLDQASTRLETQQVVIDRVQTDVEASSGLASFLDTLEIGGWVSASYTYNFEDIDGVALAGSNSGIVAANPFKADSNSFSFDQLWFELERPISEENRAGFRADIVFGKTAGLLSGLTGGDGFSGNDLEVYQAYVQYLAPIGDGVTIKAGKFATLIGAEVVQAPYNFNITRGQVYNLFQPITHTGILASTTAGPVDVTVGLVNGTRNFPASDIDVNKNKAILASISGDVNESVSISLAGTWGAAQEAGGGALAGDKETIIDLIIGFSPSDSFEAYINADYIDTENDLTGDTDGYGIAVAGRYAISERTGIAARVEYIDLEFEGVGAMARDVPLELFTVTGTVDHKLANNLTVRGEVRWDSAEDSGVPGDTLFIGDNGLLTEDDQLLGGVEIIYNF